MKVGVLFDNLGPYHLARLRAAASEIELLAVELAGRSGEYAWTTSTSPEPFQRATLFPEASSRDASSAELRHRLGDCLDTFRPDAVAVPGWSSRGAFAATQWCLRTHTPVIIMADSTEHDEPRVAWKEWVKRRYVSLASGGLVAGIPHADYIGRLGLARDCIFTGYDAVENQYFEGKAAEIRGQGVTINSNDELPTKYFLASARFLEKKNLPFLLSAYARYRSAAESGEVGRQKSEIWNLILLGDGPLGKTLSAQLSALNLNGYVFLPGFIQYPDLPRYYARAGAFVHASTTEQWGLVVNEAMASSLPVLVSNRCGCAPDLVKEGVNGWTFDPTDEGQLARLMLEVSGRGFPLSKFGDASRRIIADWGPERFAGGLRQAAQCALRIGPKRAGVLDRLLLAALVRK